MEMKRKGAIFVISIILILSFLSNITIAENNIKYNEPIIRDNNKRYHIPINHSFGESWCQIQGQVSIDTWDNWDVYHEVYVCGYTNTKTLYEDGETIWVDYDRDGINDFTAYVINFQEQDNNYVGPVNLSLIGNEFKIIKVKDYEKRTEIEVDGYYNTNVIVDDKAKNIDILVKRIEHNPPDIPTISGPEFGKVGSSYSYTVKSIDSEGEQIYYMFDWGDETKTKWHGPYDSKEEIKIDKTWENNGRFTIKVKAKDTNDMESDWSGDLEVIMPNSSILQNILEKLYNIFPMILPIIKIIYNY